MLWLLLAILATCGVYWQSLDGQLVYDDLALIGQNPLIGDLGNIPEMLSRPLWDFQNPGSTEQTGYWRPLTSMAYAFAWAVDDGAPWAFHGGSILFHLLATVGAFFLARRLCGHGWLAGSVALFFGLHPVHVESVAWISALNDPLFAGLVLFSLTWFLAWRQRGSSRIPVLAPLAFGLALMAKEMALALLPLLVLLDLAAAPREQANETRRDWFRVPPVRLRAYLPFGLVLAAYVGMRMWVFESPLAGFDRVITHFGVSAERMALLRVELWGGALNLLYWPADLRLFRPFQPNLSLADSSAQWDLALSLGSLLLLGLTLLLKRRELFFAFLIIPISFAPVLYGADAVGLFPCSDRYLYLPVFGSSLLLVMALRSLLSERSILLAALALAALFGKQSFQRAKVWQSELHLFGSEAELQPRSPYVYWGYGRVLLNEYSSTLRNVYLEEAKRAFENSQFLLEEAKRPAGEDIFASSNDYLQANLGYAHCFIIEEALYSEGNADTSIALLNNLLESVSKIHQEAELARSQGKLIKGFLPPIELVFAALGAAHFTAGNWNLAADALRKSLQLNPRNIHALKTLAKVDFARGNAVFAIKNLRLALEIAPRRGDLLLSLAQVLRDTGESREAQRIAERLLEIMPEHPGPHWVLADILMEAGKPREALLQLHQAQKLDEYNGHTWLLIAQAKFAVGTDQEGTLEAFRKAARFKPGDLQAHYNLAALLHKDGALQEAITHFVRAYALAKEPQVLLSLRSVLPQLPYQDPVQLLGLSDADWKRKEFDLVEFWLAKALELDPGFSPALMDVGRLLIQRERVAEGLASMRKGSQTSGAFSDLIDYAQALVDAGYKAEAGAAFERARTAPLPSGMREEEREQFLAQAILNLESESSSSAPLQR